jgi:hypothetical protein
VNESIAVDAGGAWSYTAVKGKPSAQGTLAPDDRDRVTAILSDPAFATEVRPQRTNARCADGFAYEVAIGAEQSNFSDCGETRPMFDQLMAILHAHTPF